MTPRPGERAALALAAAILAGLAVVPVAALLVQLVGGPGAVAAAASALGSARAWALLGRSVLVAAAVTAGAVALGAPLGVLLGRCAVPGRALALLLHAFPLFLPPFVSALGWFHLFGRSGALGSGLSARLLFSPAGAIAVLVLALTPVVTLLTASAVRGVDPAMEEAALLAAGPWRTVTGVLLPLARPAISLGGVVVFALAFSELGVPMFLRVDVYPAAVFARLGGISYAPGEAFALAAPLAAVAFALLAVERKLAGRRSAAVLGVRSREVPNLGLGRWRGAVALAVWSVALVPLGPVAMLAARAGASGFARVAEWLGASVGSSALYAASASAVALTVAVVIGHACARGRRAGAWLDAVAVLAFVTPAPVLAVGLVAAWNRPGLDAVHASGAVVVLALAARYAAVAVRAAGVAFAQGSPHLEEAAAVSGAGYFRRLARILVPVHARGLAAAWLLTLVFCLRDLETSVLLYAAGREPLTVRLFTLEANGPEPVVAALACVQVALTGAVVAAGAALAWRSR